MFSYLWASVGEPSANNIFEIVEFTGHTLLELVSQIGSMGHILLIHMLVLWASVGQPGKPKRQEF